MELAPATVERQRQIWTNLYGPARATELVARLTELASADPAMSVAELVAAADPEDVDTYVDFVATRW
jgi:hypothetical protein